MASGHRARHRSERLLRSRDRVLRRALLAALVALAVGPVGITNAEPVASSGIGHERFVEGMPATVGTPLMAPAEVGASQLGSTSVSEAPVVTTQPQDQTVTVGERAIFEASATAYQTVQWEVSTDGGAAFHADTTDSGNSTERLTIERTSAVNNGWKYRAVFESEAGAATSEAARLTVNLPPTITTEPVSQTVTAGSTATFTAAASARPTSSVQWQVSVNGGATFGNDRSDSGSATGRLTVENTSLAENGYEYRAVFSNTAGRATSTAATLTVGAPAAAVIRRPPVASFTWFPASPHIGEPVSFTSSSTDAASPITAFAWDIAGNGPFIAGAPVLITSFSSPGGHVVRLRVTDASALSSVATETVPVTLPPLILMQPFPVVRLVASDTASGVKLVTLAVLAPVGARITVTCRGHGCSVKRATRVALSRRSKRTAAVPVAFRQFEHALLRPGLVLEIRVSRPGEIGKYTKFVIRRGKLPARVDTCLNPTDSRPMTCPSSWSARDAGTRGPGRHDFQLAETRREHRKSPTNWRLTD
jgi:hypothetical protein